MSRQLDVDRLLESWLAEGPSELPDRAIQNIVRQLDENEQRRLWLPGRKRMNRMMFAIGGVAAVVIAVSAAGFYLGRNNTGVGGLPTPTATSSPTAPLPTASPAPTATPAPSAKVFPFGESQPEPGRHYTVFQRYRYTFTVPASGWVANPSSDAFVLQKDLGNLSFAAMLIFGAADDLSTDACQWGGTRSVPGPTVDDFVAALGAVAGFESSEPVEVTVDGYHGKRIQLKVPDDTNLADCQNGEYHGIEGWYNFDPGQTHNVWVLDLGGTRHVFFTVYDANTPVAAQNELTQMGDSLEIQPQTP